MKTTFQFKKKNEALRKYQQAQMSLFDGPVALEDTSKTYYTVSKGEDYAQKFSEEKLRDVANKIGDTYLEVFDELANASHSLSNLHESNLINYRNSQTLASHYTAQTEEVEDLLSDTQNEASRSLPSPPARRQLKPYVYGIDGTIIYTLLL